MSYMRVSVVAILQLLYIACVCYLSMHINKVLGLDKHEDILPPLVSIGYSIGRYPHIAAILLFLVYFALNALLCIKYKALTVIEFLVLFTMAVNIILILIANSYLCMYW